MEEDSQESVNSFGSSLAGMGGFHPQHHDPGGGGDVIGLEAEPSSHFQPEAGVSGLTLGPTPAPSFGGARPKQYSNVIVDDSPLQNQMEKNKACKFQGILLSGPRALCPRSSSPRLYYVFCWPTSTLLRKSERIMLNKK